MTLLLAIFAIVQAVGSVIGAGGSVLAEIFYIRAMQDGTLDAAEKAHLRMVADALRWGMLILLIGSIGLTLTSFVYDVPTQPALTHAYWTLMGLIFAVIFFSWALSRKKIGFLLGSAAIFCGWWYIALLVFGRLPALRFGEAVALYIVATALIACVLMYARFITAKTE
jgi:hypothetical protein